MEKYLEKEKKESLIVSSLLENQIRKEEDEEVKKEMIQVFYGDNQMSLQTLAVKISKLLQRKVFYTVGPMEARAWAISKTETAQMAAGRIHSDIAKGFIHAEVRKDFDRPARNEGRNYIVEDGDIIHFIHSN